MSEQKEILALIVSYLESTTKTLDASAKSSLQSAIETIKNVHSVELSTVPSVSLAQLYSVYKKTQGQQTKTVDVKVIDTKGAEELKALGNKHLGKKEFSLAIEKYTAAIALDQNNAVYYANRAAAYSQNVIL